MTEQVWKEGQPCVKRARKPAPQLRRPLTLIYPARPPSFAPQPATRCTSAVSWTACKSRKAFRLDLSRTAAAVAETLSSPGRKQCTLLSELSGIVVVFAKRLAVHGLACHFKHGLVRLAAFEQGAAGMRAWEKAGAPGASETAGASGASKRQGNVKPAPGWTTSAFGLLAHVSRDTQTHFPLPRPVPPVPPVPASMRQV